MKDIKEARAITSGVKAINRCFVHVPAGGRIVLNPCCSACEHELPSWLTIGRETDALIRFAAIVLIRRRAGRNKTTTITKMAAITSPTTEWTGSLRYSSMVKSIGCSQKDRVRSQSWLPKLSIVSGVGSLNNWLIAANKAPTIKVP